jgi:hypothetical protein
MEENRHMPLFEARRLVLKDYVQRIELDMVAQQQGWIVRKEVPADARRPYQKQWATQDEQIAYLYVEDQRMGVRYVEVRAVNIEEAVNEVRALFDSYSHDELKALVGMAQAPEQWQDALHKAAVGAPKTYDPDYFRVFLSGLQHPDRRVKIAAMEAAPYVKWREFEAPLAKMEQSDTVAGREAGIMLKAMREHEWNKQA